MKMTQKQHKESGCTDYLQHNADSCPHMAAPAQAHTEREQRRIAARRCVRCNHDISEYAKYLTLCAACEEEMPAQAQHSPLPFIIENGANRFYIKSGGRFVANTMDDRQGQIDAAFIVRACNNVQRLADALAWLKREPHSLEAVGHAGWALAEWKGANQ